MISCKMLMLSFYVRKKNEPWSACLNLINRDSNIRSFRSNVGLFKLPSLPVIGPLPRRLPIVPQPSLFYCITLIQQQNVMLRAELFILFKLLDVFWGLFLKFLFRFLRNIQSMSNIKLCKAFKKTHRVEFGTAPNNIRIWNCLISQENFLSHLEIETVTNHGVLKI